MEIPLTDAMFAANGGWRLASGERIANGEDVRLRQFRPGVTAADRHGAMRVFVAVIGRDGIPPEVFQPVIMPNAVVVAGLEAGRTWADERRKQERMDVAEVSLPVSIKGHLHVSVGGVEGLQVTPDIRHDGCSETETGLNPPPVADAVSREIGNREE
jgi:hypothetical protein